MATTDTDVLIIGGGLAGLTCARTLQNSKLTYKLLEADERPGGRIKTDSSEGYLFDRGFQVLQTAYPAAMEELDYTRLQLQDFAPGTAIRIGEKFHTVADPLRRPSAILSTLTAPIGTLTDRLRLFKLANKVVSGRLEDIFKESEQPTISYLQSLGFSDTIIKRFFTPFFGGACLDGQIRASNHVFLYLLKMFSSGNAAIPKEGIEQIPLQLVRDIPPENILTGSKVGAIEQGSVHLDDGRTMTARAVVIATEGHEAARLLKREKTESKSFSETCFYFSAPKNPSHTPFLVLNGNGEGPINNMAFPSMVSPAYAPEGKTLVNVICLGTNGGSTEELLTATKTQLKNWYGEETDNWQHLRTYTIPHVLPDQQPPTADPTTAEPKVAEGLFVCGEYGSLPAIQWAFLSGKKAALGVKDLLC